MVNGIVDNQIHGFLEILTHVAVEFDPGHLSPIGVKAYDFGGPLAGINVKAVGGVFGHLKVPHDQPFGLGLNFAEVQGHGLAVNALSIFEPVHFKDVDFGGPVVATGQPKSGPGGRACGVLAAHGKETIGPRLAVKGVHQASSPGNVQRIGLSSERGFGSNENGGIGVGNPALLNEIGGVVAVLEKQVSDGVEHFLIAVKLVRQLPVVAPPGLAALPRLIVEGLKFIAPYQLVCRIGQEQIAAVGFVQTRCQFDQRRAGVVLFEPKPQFAALEALAGTVQI